MIPATQLSPPRLLIVPKVNGTAPAMSKKSLFLDILAILQKGHLVERFRLWGVMSDDRPGPVGDLEDPFGVL
jgi:hypothetical protein